MTRRIPQVTDEALHVLEPSGGPEITVGSPSSGLPILPRVRSRSVVREADTPHARSAGRVVASIG
jgi:hypothetical protein